MKLLQNTYLNMANSKTANKFKEAVESTEDVKDGYCQGLQALKKVDRSKVSCSDTKKIDGSLDIDTNVKSLYPNSDRWDYAISYSGKVCYCEVHPAETSEVTKMVGKLAWLKQWLKDKAPYLNALPSYSPKYVWVASGRSNVLPTSREAKRISSSGIALKSHLTLK